MILLSFVIFAIFVAIFVYSRKDSYQQQRINNMRHRLSAYKKPNINDITIDFRKDINGVDVTHLTDEQVDTIIDIFTDKYSHIVKTTKNIDQSDLPPS